MNRKILLPLALLAIAGLSRSEPSFAAAQPMNILVLLADDWRHDTLGCAGNPVVKTPQLDRLAAEGVRFTQACVTTSICGVSRASLFTGQWMSRHGNTAFDAFRTPWEETYPGLLRDHRYWVGHVGKWHNGRFPGQHFDFGKAYAGTHWIRRPDGTKIHVTQRNEDDALEFLRTRPSRQAVLPHGRVLRHARRGREPAPVPAPAREHGAVRGRDDSGAAQRHRGILGAPAVLLHRGRTKAATAGTGASTRRRNTRR